MKVAKASKDEWNNLAEQAHLICFQEHRPREVNTFDYALVVTENDQICAYATIIEMDSQTAYMQHGGAMPNIKGGIGSFKAYKHVMAHLKANYARITTRIENKNIAMLKFALAQDLLIIGCDCYPDGVYLHLAYGYDSHA